MSLQITDHHTDHSTETPRERMHVMGLQQMQNTVYPQRTHQAKTNVTECEYNATDCSWARFLL